MLTAPLRCFRSEAGCVGIANFLDEVPDRLLYTIPTDGLHPGSCDAASAESVPFFAVSLLPRLFFYQLNLVNRDTDGLKHLLTLVEQFILGDMERMFIPKFRQ